jgi:hypothetical protein
MAELAQRTRAARLVVARKQRGREGLRTRYILALPLCPEHRHWEPRDRPAFQALRCWVGPDSLTSAWCL